MCAFSRQPNSCDSNLVCLHIQSGSKHGTSRSVQYINSRTEFTHLSRLSASLSQYTSREFSWHLWTSPLPLKPKSVTAFFFYLSQKSRELKKYPSLPPALANLVCRLLLLQALSATHKSNPQTFSSWITPSTFPFSSRPPNEPRKRTNHVHTPRDCQACHSQNHAQTQTGFSPKNCEKSRNRKRFKSWTSSPLQ